jgi:hypothetical protein
MSQLQVNRINDASGGVLAPISSVMRNRIINGAMVIDQRNAGASVTINVANQRFSVDRFFALGQATDGVYTLQQSSTAPAGFVKSMLATVTTADTSIGASQFYFFGQNIEGFNTADLGWGTANAKTVTLSFWVRSSLTGTFAGSIRNGAADRSYVFTYTISAADTWEQKSVTIAGDTTGTWLTDNQAGIILVWSLGEGSSGLTTAGSWVAGSFRGATGQTNLIATSGATFYITGVQLEVGTQATSFEYRQYGTELSLCQRYYYKIQASGTANTFGVGFCNSTTSTTGTTVFPVTMRTAPTALEQSGTASHYRVFSGGGGTTCSAVPTINSGTGSPSSANSAFTVASGLTTGQGCFNQALTADAFLAWSAEL